MSNYSRKTWSRSLIAIAAGLCLAGAAFAADTGGLRITVLGADGKPVKGATVKVSSPSSLVSKTVKTEADGTIRVTGLDPATNYRVEIAADGFNAVKAENVTVISGQNLSVDYTLGGGVSKLDTVVVTGSRRVSIDTTSATVGTTLNLAIVEALPTTRSYQGYLQLVPGVKPSAGGNPSSKSGVNYSDIGGATGTSSDNVYMLDGIDVTDHQTGTFGSNINSEIIQEQQVLTGGIPAEYAGGSGLISKVVTKSGSDEFHGSVNYYFQNDKLVAKNKHNTNSGFSTYDTAFTLGGPIIPGQLWFFGSGQKKHSSTDVVNAATGAPMRTVNSDSTLGFFKATWQPTNADRVTATWFNDPTDISGTTASTTLNNRDRGQKQGGDNYKLEYSHEMDSLRLSAYAFRHVGEVSNTAADTSSRNDVAFWKPATTPSLAARNLGGFGSTLSTWSNRDELGLTAEYFLETDKYGTHTFKSGFTNTKNQYIEDSRVTGADLARYASIAAENAGVTFSQFVGTGWTGERSIASGDTTRILNAINASPDKAYYLGLMDTDHNGAVSAAELGAYKFTSTAGNPGGQVNNYRIKEAAAAKYDVKATGRAFYLQDSWTMDRLSVNAGVRAEEWSHYDSQGKQSMKFTWKAAPRLSAVYDLTGDGSSKIWGFGGRYYDPVRTNMSDFAGALTGPVLDEQIFLGDRWLTFRTRGGLVTPDAVFAPSTKTPYTDEFMIGWATAIARDYTVSATYTKRKTRDLLEDYDLSLYSDPTLDPADPHGNTGYAAPGTKYYLPYSYFGYTGQPNSNYVIGTLAGGKRDYQGIEFSLTKRKSNNWQGSLSYTYNRAHGNSNSDSNADFQGDWIALDPRAPNQYGPQPGNIKHQFKAFGSYFFENGFEASGVFNWNSGVLYSRTFAAYRRNLPEMQDDATNDGGVYETWIKPNTVGAYQGPSFYTFDVRLKYQHKFAFGKAEFFLDVFNVLDKQLATSAQPLAAGNGVYAFGQANAWLSPRRFYLGMRYSF